jgi:anaerobic magnesium-protoporphyrin IX monomethyl ester cyclase
MKVLFVIPPIKGRKISSNDAMPLGVLYLASMIRDICEIRILDCFSNPLDDQLGRILDGFRPDIIAVSIPFKAVESSVKEIIASVKQRTDSTIIIGGLHASLAISRIRTEIPHDFAIYGEAEIIFRELMLYLLGKSEKIPENVFKPGIPLKIKRGQIPDIDKIPHPSRDLLPNREIYLERIIASRGCGFHCGFCSSVKFWGSYRGRNPDLIIDELEEILKARGIVPISFADDSLTYERERIINLCEKLIERSVKTGGMGFSSHPDRLDEDLLDRMRNAGFDSIFLGLESASPSVLKKAGKKYDRNGIEKIISHALKLGYQVHASFMIGLPQESKEDIDLTLNWADSLPLKSLGFHIFYPFEGCPIRDNPAKYGIRILESIENQGDINGEAVIHNGVLSPVEILDYYYRARALARKKASE